MENQPTKLERILQAMDPKTREKSEKILEVYNQRLVERSISESFKKVIKEYSGQLKLQIEIYKENIRNR